MKPNPIGSDTCGKEDCFVCKSGGKNCHQGNVFYNFKCEPCEEGNVNARYHGESCRNLYTRAGEHMSKYDKGDPNSFIHKHQVEVHNSEPARFKATTVKSFKDPLSRQVTEAVWIKNHTGGPLLNSKSEFFQPPIVRIQQEILTGLDC